LLLFLVFGRSLLLGAERHAILDAKALVVHAVRAGAPRPREGLLS
jgi:hypothetical protein